MAQVNIYCANPAQAGSANPAQAGSANPAQAGSANPAQAGSNFVTWYSRNK